mmetsp:Transcript_8498/g.27087  ORF Transcript_8498/g.27087 Transcript_8498/m.27087 type:complete len:175 (+) Transcript_8498:910-1434(+)
MMLEQGHGRPQRLFVLAPVPNLKHALNIWALRMTSCSPLDSGNESRRAASMAWHTARFSRGGLRGPPSRARAGAEFDACPQHVGIPHVQQMDSHRRQAPSGAGVGLCRLEQVAISSTGAQCMCLRSPCLQSVVVVYTGCMCSGAATTRVAPLVPCDRAVIGVRAVDVFMLLSRL